jgi:diguanylate cyclase (GGDEF)-like protein/PAS domain S-box-containing protein
VSEPPISIDANDRLRLAGHWLQALTDGSREIVTLVDGRGQVLFMSMTPASKNLVGYDASELLTQPLNELVHPEDQERLMQAFSLLAGEPSARRTVEYRARHRQGHWVRAQSTAVNWLADPVVGAIVVHTREAAVVDAPVSSSELLSQFPDRLSFTQAVADAVQRAETDNDYGFSVLNVELDRFKMMVGNYGQEVVQLLLEEVGNRLRDVQRARDTLGQLGGGEFSLLLDGIGDRRRAQRAAEKIQKSLSKAFEVGGQTITTSAIVGIATSERRYGRADDVIRDAALATNRARAGGNRKRRAVFQTQMRVEDTNYMSLVAGMHRALQRNQFVVHYQPIVSLASRALSGFEALVRWAHPEKGLIPPGMFIPVAEETGMIVQLGQWVLAEACRQMSEWRRDLPGLPPLDLSVNLSTKQLLEEDLDRQVERVLRETGFDASQLKLELTESAVLENREAATEALHKLKAHGLKLSLDDFGTGYSSFSYLHQLPYDTLKIDRSFVSRLGEEGGNTEIIHAIIVLAHNLRMDVVAEGVETQEQAAQLQNMWCEYAQGYHFAKPLPADEARGLLDRAPSW